MRPARAHVTTGGVTTGSGDNTIGSAAAAWDAVRADPATQFAPIKAPPPPQPPDWLTRLLKALAEMLRPLGEALGMSWPVFKWLLLALAAAAVLWLAWRLLAPLLDWRPRPAAEDDTEWAPAAHEALALLEDADRLAAEGRFDEATHLLLRRSVSQIASVRPELIEPATTARELAALSALPHAARTAFGVIASRVEASRFALRSLGEGDWQAARGAYADFALTRLAAA